MKACCVPHRANVESILQEPTGLSGNQGGPKRIQFPAARSFVGTNEPIIALDGEGPRRSVSLSAFALESVAVTNERFAEFVRDTRYKTEAERFGWSAVFRGLLDTDSSPAFGQTPWWLRVDGASWSAPEGPGTSTIGRDDHPVVHVSWSDAKAFAQWCGGRLPTEAEWEHAARGGLLDPRFPWGNEEPSDSSIFANLWQGTFPSTNTLADGYLGTCPVDAFPANGAGLFGMAGNVWEWTADAFRVRSLSRDAKARNILAQKTREKVLKGGSFLCHISYCYRYRIAARSALTAASSASNVGFRIAY
jgi:formylglycine-generating enzyme required for sulfatase activity